MTDRYNFNYFVPDDWSSEKAPVETLYQNTLAYLPGILLGDDLPKKIITEYK